MVWRGPHGPWGCVRVSDARCLPSGVRNHVQLWYVVATRGSILLGWRLAYSQNAGFWQSAIGVSGRGCASQQQPSRFPERVLAFLGLRNELLRQRPDVATGAAQC